MSPEGRDALFTSGQDAPAGGNFYKPPSRPAHPLGPKVSAALWERQDSDETLSPPSGTDASRKRSFPSPEPVPKALRSLWEQGENSPLSRQVTLSLDLFFRFSLFKLLGKRIACRFLDLLLAWLPLELKLRNKFNLLITINEINDWFMIHWNPVLAYERFRCTAAPITQENLAFTNKYAERITSPVPVGSIFIANPIYLHPANVALIKFGKA